MLFYAEQNARTVKAAEEYHRTMFTGRVSSWNLRDRHMTDTLDALAVHLSRQRGAQAKIVVWAHNSHLGDARATEMALSAWRIHRRVGMSAGLMARAILRETGKPVSAPGPCGSTTAPPTSSATSTRSASGSPRSSLGVSLEFRRA
jgi:erythromycin esterase-like protein